MLQPLPPNKAWELSPRFRKTVSYENCKGLPLAIVAIGGLLSTKHKTIFEWQNLHDSLGYELMKNCHLASVGKILSLS